MSREGEGEGKGEDEAVGGEEERKGGRRMKRREEMRKRKGEEEDKEDEEEKRRDDNDSNAVSEGESLDKQVLSASMQCIISSQCPQRERTYQHKCPERTETVLFSSQTVLWVVWCAVRG